jgi:hypothetical protein
MSEHHQPHHERAESLPKPGHSVEHNHGQAERELTSAEKQHGNQEHLENIQKSVEQQAISAKEHAPSHHEHTNQHPVLINKQLKNLAFSRSMTRTRKKLSAPSKVFSKVIHSSVIDSSSEFVGKTIARPSGMLGGAFVAFIGTSALLWITKHYGYEYNYLLVVLLFVGGSIIGVAGEYLLNLRHRK